MMSKNIIIIDIRERESHLPLFVAFVRKRTQLFDEEGRAFLRELWGARCGFRVDLWAPLVDVFAVARRNMFPIPFPFLKAPFLLSASFFQDHLSARNWATFSFFSERKPILVDSASAHGCFEERKEYTVSHLRVFTYKMGQGGSSMAVARISSSVMTAS